MVQLSFVPSILTLLVFAIPGLFASFAILAKSKFSRFEKVLFGLFFASFLPPFLGVLEKMLGFNFSAGLVFFNLALISVASIILWFYFRNWSFNFDFKNLI